MLRAGKNIYCVQNEGFSHMNLFSYILVIKQILFIVIVCKMILEKTFLRIMSISSWIELL